MQLDEAAEDMIVTVTPFAESDRAYLPMLLSFLNRSRSQQFKPHTRVDPADIAESYYRAAVQRRSAWTHELDLRPFSETF